MKLRLLGGAPAALARNQLVAPAGERADDHRLDDPARGDRGGELLERGLVEMTARLIRVRLDRGDRQAGEAVARLAGRRRRRSFAGPILAAVRDQRFLAPRLAEQRAQPAPQLAPRRRARIGPVLG